uniref:Uncharacterized protein n=1 Tax=Romanomermis culicivorax TaxID=13658 RepID=A0A915L1H5_ROMCU
MQISSEEYQSKTIINEPQITILKEESTVSKIKAHYYNEKILMMRRMDVKQRMAIDPNQSTIVCLSPNLLQLLEGASELRTRVAQLCRATRQALFLCLLHTSSSFLNRVLHLNPAWGDSTKLYNEKYVHISAKTSSRFCQHLPVGDRAFGKANTEENRQGQFTLKKPTQRQEKIR